MADTQTQVRARATLYVGMPDGTTQKVARGQLVTLSTAEAERLHNKRLADIEGEPTTKIEAPPPVQNSKGKTSVLPPPEDASPAA